MPEEPKQYANQLHAEFAKWLPRAWARRRTSKITAIRLFCIECMGGSVRDAIECDKTLCFLHPHRGFRWSQEGRAAEASGEARRRHQDRPDNAPLIDDLTPPRGKTPGSE